MDNFKRVVSECNLGDLSFKGSKFTCSNKQDSWGFVKERLDRALATPEWCGQFSNSSVEVLMVTTSDHRPLWLRFNSSFRLAPKLFRFEAS
jgi:hypothetical protein